MTDAVREERDCDCDCDCVCECGWDWDWRFVEKRVVVLFIVAVGVFGLGWGDAFVNIEVVMVWFGLAWIERCRGGFRKLPYPASFLLYRNMRGHTVETFSYSQLHLPRYLLHGVPFETADCDVGFVIQLSHRFK